MARFETAGIDEIVKDMKNLGELSGEAADEMLLAGAEEVKEAWRFTAAAHVLKHTGDMINSIDYPNQPKTVAGVKQIDIYPQGKDSKGIRNAEKAFILHYGTSSIKATHWVDDADEMAGPRVQEAMEEKFDTLLRKKGMID